MCYETPQETVSRRWNWLTQRSEVGGRFPHPHTLKKQKRTSRFKDSAWRSVSLVASRPLFQEATKPQILWFHRYFLSSSVKETKQEKKESNKNPPKKRKKKSYLRKREGYLPTYHAKLWWIHQHRRKNLAELSCPFGFTFKNLMFLANSSKHHHE